MDGNGQLFLALQDISMSGFLGSLDGAKALEQKQDRQRVLIIFTDEEWDIKKLKNGFGDGLADKDSIVTHVHEVRILN